MMSSSEDGISFCPCRAARLLPLYYLVSLVAYIFGIPPAFQTPTSLLMLMTVTFIFSLESFFPVCNCVLWSLGIGISMGLLFPLLVIARRKLGVWPVLGATSIFAASIRFYGNHLQFWGQNPVLNCVEGGLLGHRGRLDRWAAPLLNNLFHVACVFGVLGLLPVKPNTADGDREPTGLASRHDGLFDLRLARGSDFTRRTLEAARVGTQNHWNLLCLGRHDLGAVVPVYRVWARTRDSQVVSAPSWLMTRYDSDRLPRLRSVHQLVPSFFPFGSKIENFASPLRCKNVLTLTPNTPSP